MMVRKQKQRKDGIWLKDLSTTLLMVRKSQLMQPSTLTYSADHVVLGEGEGSTTRFMSSYRLENKGGILNIYNNNRRAQSQMAWVRTP